LTDLYSKQSSAKSLTWDLTHSGRSLMWHKKRRDPRTVLWGTPDSTEHDNEESLRLLLFVDVV
jgi:hypothetical protein